LLEIDDSDIEGAFIAIPLELPPASLFCFSVPICQAIAAQLNRTPRPASSVRRQRAGRTRKQSVTKQKTQPKPMTLTDQAP